MRLHRQKLRDLLPSDLNIQEGKGIVAVKNLPSGGVVAHFSDGTSATGSVPIGADGNNSKVRKCLMGSEANLNLLPVNLVGV